MALPAVMVNSAAPFRPLWRLLLLAGPLLLLLGLNGRTVDVLRPARPSETRASATPRVTVLKQKVTFEAAASPGRLVAPPPALGWLPEALPASWLAESVRWWPRALPAAAPALFVAQQCRQRLLAVALRPQAP